LREALAVEPHEPIREAITELLLLRRARDPPIRAEHETADAGHVEILPHHLTEVGGFCRERHIGAADH
jgi:hypothetical protein